MTVDDLRFEVRRSESRRTVQITVDRHGELILSAPTSCAPSVMERFVRDKRFWIYTKLAEKEALQPTVAEKEYVSGEGFSYLGRSYRLLLVGKQDVPVKLDAGRFKMRRADATEGREHMVRWYADHAQPWLTRRVDRYAGRVRVEPSEVVVRDLGYRWGSCGKEGTLNFHWKSILLPPSIVEYIIVHELVHLHEDHHTPEFWLRVERAMPDFVVRKQWLGEHGGEVTSL